MNIVHNIIYLYTMPWPLSSRVDQTTFFWKVVLQTAFPVVLPQNMILTNFHKKILIFRGAQLDLVYDVIK